MSSIGPYDGHHCTQSPETERHRIMRPFLSAMGRWGICCLGGLIVPATLGMTPDSPPPLDEPEEPRVELARFETRMERDQHLLAQAYPDEARWLTTPQGELLVLYKPALHSEPKGTLLMAHSADRPGDWPPFWENLRRTLPYSGWATLALTLPTPPKAEIPPRPDTPIAQNVVENPDESEASTEDTNDATDVPEQEHEQEQEQEEEQEEERETEIQLTRAQRIGLSLDAALAALPPGSDQNRVLLVDNVSAEAALAHLQPLLQLTEPDELPGRRHLTGPVHALVLVNLYPSQPLSTTQLQALFAVPELPVLDLFPGPDSAPNRQQRQLHRGLARQQNLAHYQAVLMPPATAANVNNQSAFWARRLQGFMGHQNSAATLSPSAAD